MLSRLREWEPLQDGPTDWLGGLRLACAFLLPVAVGVLVDQKMTGLFVGVRAFMVGNSDLGESYAQRLRLMVPATLAIAAMTALGMGDRYEKWLAVPIGALVILTGAVIAAVGREAALFGTFFSLALVVGRGAGRHRAIDRRGVARAARRRGVRDAAVSHSRRRPLTETERNPNHGRRYPPACVSACLIRSPGGRASGSRQPAPSGWLWSVLRTSPTGPGWSPAR